MAFHCAAVRTQVFLWRHLTNELAISLIAIQLQREGGGMSWQCEVLFVQKLLEI